MVSPGSLNIGYLDGSVFPRVRSPHFPTKKKTKQKNGRDCEISRRFLFLSKNSRDQHLWEEEARSRTGQKGKLYSNAVPSEPGPTAWGTLEHTWSIRAVPQWAEMLYTPAIICGLSWQGGSLQPKGLRVRGHLLTALPGAGETSPSLKGGSGRQMSAFTTVHTWHCTDPLRLCSRSCSSRIPMGLPGGNLEMKVSGMKYRPHPAAGLGATLILNISLLHDPFWITLTLKYHLCMSQWTTWWQDPVTEGSGLLVTMPFSGQDGCTCPFTITVEQGSSKRHPSGSFGCHSYSSLPVVTYPDIKVNCSCQDGGSLFCLTFSGEEGA